MPPGDRQPPEFRRSPETARKNAPGKGSAGTGRGGQVIQKDWCNAFGNVVKAASSRPTTTDWRRTTGALGGSDTLPLGLARRRGQVVHSLMCNAKRNGYCVARGFCPTRFAATTTGWAGRMRPLPWRQAWGLDRVIHRLLCNAHGNAMIEAGDSSLARFPVNPTGLAGLLKRLRRHPVPRRPGLIHCSPCNSKCNDGGAAGCWCLKDGAAGLGAGPATLAATRSAAWGFFITPPGLSGRPSPGPGRVTARW